MRKLEMLVFAILCHCTVHAQEKFRKNDFYFEALGSGGFASLNYERRLMNKRGLGIRAGVGAYYISRPYVSIPLIANYLIRIGDGLFIDAGAGATFSLDLGPTNSEFPERQHYTTFSPTLGIRRHNDRNGMWRISYTPFGAEYGGGGIPWIGISFGSRF